MCGIAGAIGTQPDVRVVRRMQAALVHRGPDSEGFVVDGPVALAIRRLKIIDLDGGDQPFKDPASGVVLVVNGEIYNHEELRRDLLTRGYVLRSRSDCETLLWLYVDRGLDFLREVRGMFAFALWDPRYQQVVLGRDRMGEKPLFIARGAYGLIFSSEMKSLLSSGLVPFTIEPTALHRFFHFHYVPEPMTMLRGVSKLPRACMLVVNVQTLDEKLINYWRMEDAREIIADNPSDVIRASLEEVARLTVRSDVPIGVSLSGGLDSSALAALMAKYSSRTAHAFTVGYPGALRNDERWLARKTASHLGLTFHEYEVRTEDVVERFASTIERLDEPIADIASSCYRRVAEGARSEGVPVLIQGQGGDELFWGYSWLRRALYEAHLKRLKLDEGRDPGLIGLASGPRDWTPKQIAIWVKDGFDLLPAWASRQRIMSSTAGRLPFYDINFEFCRVTRFLAQAMTQEVFAAIDGDPKDVFTGNDDRWVPEIEITKLICDTYLLTNGLGQADRIGMAESVEVRSPLVDHVFVETVIGLRKAQSDVNLPPKQWLRDAVRDTLLPEIQDRPKLGFEPPIKEWCRSLLRRYGDMLADGFLVREGFFVRDVFSSLRSFNPLRQRSHMLSFDAIVLEQWCQIMNQMVRPAQSTAPEVVLPSSDSVQFAPA